MRPRGSPWWRRPCFAGHWTRTACDFLRGRGEGDNGQHLIQWRSIQTFDVRWDTAVVETEGACSPSCFRAGRDLFCRKGEQLRGSSSLLYYVYKFMFVKAGVAEDEALAGGAGLAAALERCGADQDRTPRSVCRSRLGMPSSGRRCSSESTCRPSR
jgi:hypothetical protein